MSEHTEGHPEGRVRVSVMLVSVSTTVESLIVPGGRRGGDCDWTRPCDNNRWIMSRIGNTRAAPSKNGIMSAKDKRWLCPPNEDEQ